MEYQTVFVIRRNDDINRKCYNYSTHGEKAGVPDAIGYDETVHARKLRTEEEAQEFICTELPEWGRALHHPVEVRPSDLCFYASPLCGAMFQKNVKISDDLLKPTPGRLLIWMR